MIWPSSGWKRSFVYIKHRLLRLPHSTHDIVMGLASGCVISWTPLFGIQILQCFIFCKIVRANFLAAVLGTTFGNPWTFPFLLWISYQIGRIAMISAGYDGLLEVQTDQTKFLSIIEDLKDIALLGLANLGNFLLGFININDFFFVDVTAKAFEDVSIYLKEIFLPTVVGGYIMAFLTFPMFYYGFYYMIEAGRAAKQKVGKTAHVFVEKVHDIQEHRKEKKNKK